MIRRAVALETLIEKAATSPGSKTLTVPQMARHIRETSYDQHRSRFAWTPPSWSLADLIKWAHHNFRHFVSHYEYVFYLGQIGFAIATTFFLAFRSKETSKLEKTAQQFVASLTNSPRWTSSPPAQNILITNFHSTFPVITISNIVPSNLVTLTLTNVVQITTGTNAELTETLQINEEP